jgi:cobalt-zinc-cadmium efflux system outer membrane protein
MSGLLMAGAMGMMLMQAVPAPAGLTLDQAIAEALRAEPGVQAARAEADAVRGERSQTALRPNPETMFEQREQAGGSDRQTTIGVELPLDLFRRDPRIAAADASVSRAAAMAHDRERLLAALVRERYGDLLTAIRRLEVLDAGVAAARKTQQLLGNRVSEGAAPPLERDQALVELRRLEGERALAAGRVGTAKAGLNVVLGRSPSTPLTLADSLERLATTDVGPAVAAPQRADVQAAAADLDAAKAGTQLAGQSSKPELRLFGSYMRMDAMFPQSGFSPSGAIEPIHGIFHNVAAGVRVTLPVFDRGQGSAAAASARERAAAAVLAERRLAVDAEVSAAASRLDAARAALAIYADGTRTLAGRNLDVMRETYTLGRATLLDVLAEQRRYLEFEAAYTTALAEAFAAATDVLRAKGALQ